MPSSLNCRECGMELLVKNVSVCPYCGSRNLVDYESDVVVPIGDRKVQEEHNRTFGEQLSNEQVNPIKHKDRLISLIFAAVLALIIAGGITVAVDLVSDAPVNWATAHNSDYCDVCSRSYEYNLHITVGSSQRTLHFCYNHAVQYLAANPNTPVTGLGTYAIREAANEAANAAYTINNILFCSIFLISLVCIYVKL